MGAVTPLGNDAETFWENLTAGQSGAGPITVFDPSSAGAASYRELAREVLYRWRRAELAGQVNGG